MIILCILGGLLLLDWIVAGFILVLSFLYDILF